jgi:hypothetical protein
MTAFWKAGAPALAEVQIGGSEPTEPPRSCCTRAQHHGLQLVLGSVLQRRRKSRRSLKAR